IQLEDLPDSVREVQRRALPPAPSSPAAPPPVPAMAETLERDAIVRALDACKGNQTDAAKLLGLTRRTLIYRMEKHGLKSPPASPPAALPDHALCVCDDFDQVGALTVRAGSGPGSVGVNGRSRLVGRASVDGDFIAYSGFSGVGTSVGATLATIDSVDVVGDLDVGSAMVGGDLK